MIVALDPKITLIERKSNSTETGSTKKTKNTNSSDWFVK